MTERKVDVFFYGSFINLRVLQQVDYAPNSTEIAKLSGFEIVIAPLANLARSDNACVYGILTTATHDELGRLYTYARDGLGETYRPEAVLTQTADKRWCPALCYVAHEMAPTQADPEYVERIAKPARKFGFPGWYVDHIESFGP